MCTRSVRSHCGAGHRPQDGTPTTLTFAHVSSEVGAEEAEEVGVEHLLRDIKNVSAAESLAQKIQRQLTSLKVGQATRVHPSIQRFAQELGSRIVEIADYLDLVVQKKLPINHPIVYQLQARRRRCRCGREVLAGDLQPAAQPGR